MKLTQKHARHIAESEDAITEFVGKRRKLIILKEPAENPPANYAQLVLSYKGERLVALTPEKVKFYMAGAQGPDREALDDIAEFYNDCKDFEGDLHFEGLFSVQQTDVSTLARTSYATHILNRLLKNNSEGIEFNKTELDRLCLTDKYVADRIKTMAAIQTGKKTEDLRKAKLEDLLVDVTTEVQYTESYQVECDCGSHIEYRTEHRTKHRNETFTVNPEIARLETDIEHYRKDKGKEITPHDTALIKQFANVSYIAKENPDKQFDIMPPNNCENEDKKP